MNQKRIDAVLGLSVWGLFFIPLVVLGYFSYPISDDFSLFVAVQKSGAIAYLVHTYFHWSGRILSDGFMIFWFAFFDPFSGYTLAAVFGMLFVLLCMMLVHLTASRSALSSSAYSLTAQAVVTFVAVSAFWWGGRDILGQCVFWITGGMVYLIPSILGIAWIQQFEWALREAKRPGVIGYLVLSVVLGTGNQLLSPALVTYALLFWLGERSSVGMVSKKRWSLYVAGLLLGTAGMIFAPGGFRRAAFEQGSFRIPLKAMPLFYLHLVKYFLAIGGWGFIGLSALAGLLLGLTCRSDSPRPARLQSSTWLLCALATLSPMGFVPGFVEQRTGWFFLLFWFLTVASVFWRAGRFLENSLTPRSRPSGQALSLLLCTSTLAFFFLPSSYHEIVLARQVSMQFRERDRILKGIPSGPWNVVVGKVQGRIPWRLHFDDIRPDTTYWLNVVIAEYYHLHSIQMGEGQRITVSRAPPGDV